MNVSLIAERYAKALFELAIENNVLEDVYKDITGLSALISETRALRLFLKSPVINPGKKISVLDILLKDFTPLTRSFVRLLVVKRREFTIPEISVQFIEQYNRYKNIMPLKVETAYTIDEEFRRQLISVMGKYTGSDIQITEKLDDSLIGGFILFWDDKQYDASIRKQIERMKRGMARINLYVKGI
jgi:F-type H+-transporting ATPase subunit delta